MGYSFLESVKTKDFLELKLDILIVLLLKGSADQAVVIHTTMSGGIYSARNRAS